MDGFNLATIRHSLTEAREGYWSQPVSQTISYARGRSEECYEAEADSGWFDHRNQVIAATLEIFPPGPALVDVGGGNGFVAHRLQQAGHAVALVEPGEAASIRAWERGVRPVVWSTLEDAAFEPGTLPSVGLFDVLEHHRDPEAFLSSIERLLTPGGRLYITVPAHRWLWSSHDIAAGHLRRYSQRRLAGELRRAGFEIEYLSAYFGPLPLAVLLRRSIPTLWGRRKLATAPMDGYPSRDRSMLARLLDARYAAERGLLRRRPKRFGASLIAVARTGL